MADRAIAASILGGSAILAVAVYLGLRSRPVVVAPGEATTSVASAIAPAAPSSAPSAPTIVPAVPALASVAPKGGRSPAIDEAARAALEKTRPTLVEKCWRPSAAKSAVPDHAAYTFDVAFDEKGEEAGRAVSAAGQPQRIDVEKCLERLYAPIAIPPPGGRTMAHVTITLP